MFRKTALCFVLPLFGLYVIAMTLLLPLSDSGKQFVEASPPPTYVSDLMRDPEPTTTTTSTTTAPTTTSPPPRAPRPTTTVPESPVATQAPSGPVEQIIAAWFPENPEKAIQVARCESGLNPGAVSSGGGNHGLFQINNVHRGTFEAVTGQPWDAVYDANTNAKFARHLYNSSGWGPWACA